MILSTYTGGGIKFRKVRFGSIICKLKRAANQSRPSTVLAAGGWTILVRYGLAPSSRSNTVITGFVPVCNHLSNSDLAIRTKPCWQRIHTALSSSRKNENTASPGRPSWLSSPRHNFPSHRKKPCELKTINASSESTAMLDKVKEASGWFKETV